MDIVFRASVIFVFLWIVTRALGKRELGEMSPFEMILLMVMGDLVQQAVTQEDYSITGGVLAVSTLSLWILLFSWASFRWKRARHVAEGVPSIVIRDGEPLFDVLKLERVPLDDLLDSARNHGIADLQDVEWGILEPDGKFSFVKRSGGDVEKGEDKHTAG